MLQNPEISMAEINTRSRSKAVTNKLEQIFTIQWKTRTGTISDTIQKQIKKLAEDIATKGLQSIDDDFKNFGTTAAAVIQEWNQSDSDIPHLNELKDSPAGLINENIDNPDVIEEMYKPAIEEVNQKPPNPEPDQNEQLNIAQDTINNLTQRLAEAQKAVAHLERMNDNLVNDTRKALEDREKILQLNEKLNQDLQNAGAQIKANAQNLLMNKGLQREILNLKQELLIANDQIYTYSKYKQRSNDLEDEIKILEKKDMETSKTLQELKSKIEALEKKLKETKQWTDKEKNLGEELHRLQNQIENFKETEETLKLELEEARANMRSNEDLQDENKNLKERLFRLGSLLKEEREKAERSREPRDPSWKGGDFGSENEYNWKTPYQQHQDPRHQDDIFGFDHNSHHASSRILENSKRKLQNLAEKEIEKLPQYTGGNASQTIADYYSRLEQLITTSFDKSPFQEEDNILKANILLTKLGDPARSHIENTLSPSQKFDHREIIAELKRRFEYGRDEYFYKNKLRDIPGDGRTDFIELVGNIENLVKNLIRCTSPEVEEGTPTYKTLFETYARGYVEEKMSKTHLTFIKCQNRHLTYQTLKEAGARLDEVNKSGKPTRVNTIESTIFGPDTDKQKNNAPVCKNCKRTGHKENDCWRKYPEKAPKPKPTQRFTGRLTNQGPPRPEPATCEFCGRRGHQITDCRDLQKYSRICKDEIRSRPPLYCERCKTTGHSTERCNQLRGAQSNTGNTPQN